MCKKSVSDSTRVNASLHSKFSCLVVRVGVLLVDATSMFLKYEFVLYSVRSVNLYVVKMESGTKKSLLISSMNFRTPVWRDDLDDFVRMGELVWQIL